MVRSEAAGIGAHTWLTTVVYENGARFVDPPSLDRVLMKPMKRGVIAEMSSL